MRCKRSTMLQRYVLEWNGRSERRYSSGLGSESLGGDLLEGIADGITPLARTNDFKCRTIVALGLFAPCGAHAAHRYSGAGMQECA